MVKDNYLHQLVDFPTRLNNTVDLLLTNIPDKVINMHGFQDVIDTDHTLVILTWILTFTKNRKSNVQSIISKTETVRS